MSEFGDVLIKWYEENKRNLPWRDTIDPYAIWISEIILQQTRVAQGYDYYLRFMKRFPDVKTLADAEEDEVLKYWQGLGYYSRARNLHAAAKSMCGEFPKTYEGVRALKGVGDYTAAAICSISYGLPYAVVDGNVYRVLSRYFGIETPIDSTEGKKLYAALANELLDKQQPALFNQAIMDFGAIQCTPLSPKCMFCPFVDTCVARKKNLINKLPVKQNKTKVRDRYFNYFYVRKGEYIYINKRDKKDIWEGLFELPLIETIDRMEDEELFSLPAFRELFTEGDQPVVISLKRDVKHVLSHQIIYTNFYEVGLPEDSLSFSDYKKVNINDLDEYAFPKLVHAFLKEVLR